MQPFSQGMDPPHQRKRLRRSTPSRLSKPKPEPQLSVPLSVSSAKEEDVPVSPHSIQSSQQTQSQSQSQPSQPEPPNSEESQFNPAQPQLSQSEPSQSEPSQSQPSQSQQTQPHSSRRKQRRPSRIRAPSQPRQPATPAHSNPHQTSQEANNNSPDVQSLPSVTNGSQLPPSQKSACPANAAHADEILPGQPRMDQREVEIDHDDGEPSVSPPKLTLQGSDASESDDGTPDLAQSYHIRSFLHVLREAVAEHQHCLPRGELELAQSLLRLEWSSLSALYLFIRMYRRKNGWLKEEHLKEKYECDLPTGSTVADAVKELRDEDFLEVLSSGENGDREAAIALLGTMKVVQLRSLWGKVPGGEKLKSKKDIVAALEALLSEPSRSVQLPSQTGRPLYAHTPTKSPRGGRSRGKVQGTLTKESPADRITRCILTAHATDVRIPSEVVRKLQRLHLVATLRDDDDVQRDLALAFTAERKFFKYSCVRTAKVFPSAEALEAFEHAREFERQMEEAVAAKDWITAGHIGAAAEREVRRLLVPPDGTLSAEAEEPETDAAAEAPPRQPEDEERRQLQHPFLRRYTAHWVYLRAAWRSVAAHEALGEHATAVKRLQLLLTADMAAKRRGKMLNRLTINLNDHLRRPEDALRRAKSALAGGRGQRLHIGDRLELAKRAEIIHRELQRGEIEGSLPAELSGKKRSDEAKRLLAESVPRVIRKTLDLLQREIAEQKFYRMPVSVKKGQSTGKRKRAAMEEDLQGEITKGGEGKIGAAARRGKTGTRIFYKSLADNKTLVGVEELAMEWYHARGEWSGGHDEGGAFRFIFALLFWEAALFAAVPDVFHTPFQSAPLDLHTEAFYASRKPEIDARVNEIEQMDARALEREVLRLHRKLRGTECVGCRWEASGQADAARVFTGEQLACIAGGIGGRSVGRICKMLARDYSYWGGGIADVVLWRRGEDGEPRAKMVEVKSARDTLSSRQRAWLAELADMGVECEVFKVVEKQMKKDLVALREAELGCEELSRLKKS